MARWIGNALNTGLSRLAEFGGDDPGEEEGMTLEEASTAEELRELLAKFQFEQIEVTREYSKLISEKEREVAHWKKEAHADGRDPAPLPTEGTDGETGASGSGEGGEEYGGFDHGALAAIFKTNTEREVVMRRQEETIRDLEQEIGSLKFDLKLKHQDWEGLKRENDRLQADKKQNDEAVELMMEEYSTLSSEMQRKDDDHAAKVEHFDATKRDLHARIEDYEQKLKTLSESAALMSTTLGAAHAAPPATAAATTAAASGATSEEVAQLTQDLTEAQQATQALQTRNGELEAALASAKAAMESAKAAAEQDAAAWRAQHDELKQKLQYSSDATGEELLKASNQIELLTGELEAAKTAHAQALKSAAELANEQKVAAVAEVRAELSAAHARALEEAASAGAGAAEIAMQTARAKAQEEHEATLALERATVQERTQQLQQAQDECAKVTAELSAVRLELEQEARQREADAEKFSEQRDQLRAELDTATGELRAKEAELRELREQTAQEAETASKQHAQALAAAQATAAEAQATAVQAERDASAAAVAAVEAEKGELQGKLDNIEAVTEQRLKQAAAAFEEEMTAAMRGAEQAKQQALANAEAAFDQERVLIEAEKEEAHQMALKENRARKIIHNKLIELQGNIRVFARCRPLVQAEISSGQARDVTSFPTPEDVVIQRDEMTKSKFEFDAAYRQDSSQEEVFESVKPIVTSFVDGYNVCIFAYGQTGSGKTFTMEGPPDNRGVNFRSLEELFALAQTRSEDYEYVFQLSYLEIYNETIRDLLDDSRRSGAEQKKLEIRQTSDQGMQVAGLTEVPVSSLDEVSALMARGAECRAVGSHDMNEHSSRSHSILTIQMQARGLKGQSSVRSKLHLIDLAGSERVSKTDATGERLKEAQNINRSLSALGDVINALSGKKAAHVPYRNSKLTFLLQDSLSGNSKVLMFCNISPASYNLGETMCTLNFASRCRAVELGQAKKGTESAELNKYKRMVQKLTEQLAANGGGGGGSNSSSGGIRSSPNRALSPAGRAARTRQSLG